MTPFLRLLLVLFLAAASAFAQPVEFAFRPAPAPGSPFARELWAEVTTPAGEQQVRPAFYRGDGQWAVRVRAAKTGTYRLGRITESHESGYKTVEAVSIGDSTAEVTSPVPGPIRIDPRSPRHFVHSDGEAFFPFGANLPWATGEPDEYYPRAFAAAREAGLNWTRVWMAHWGRLNLDWRDAKQGASPPRGDLDLEAAERWDRLVQLAESSGLYLQVVLQHHGQYSSWVNSDWAINPWNVANGGFLASPSEFFTSPEARALTRRKYRYIVARWGYSPALFAWELFNEVKWTDARTGPDATPASNAAVAEWHAHMARYIRSLDTEAHLITTSDDNLGHALYGAMDFLQPHLYARDLLAAVRRFDRPARALNRPIFYGEVGDDNVTTLPAALRDTGYSNLPLAWAGLMNEGGYPAQIWYADRLLKAGGLDGLAALTAFVRESGLAHRNDMVAFSPAVRASSSLPYTVFPGAHWHRQPAPTVYVPFDGQAPAELGSIPNTLVAEKPVPSAALELEPFPSRVELQLDVPRDTTATLRFAGADPRGASVRVQLDGQVAGEHVWAPIPPEAKNPPPQPPVEFVLPLKPGLRRLELSNPHGPEWVELHSLRTGLEIPAIAAVGRRASDLIVLWIYHRAGVFSVEEQPAVPATLVLAEVPAGTWRVTWWNVETGKPQSSEEVRHGGGTWHFPTPPVSRYTAVWLSRVGD